MTNESNPKQAQGITAITVSGFKSLREESRIEIRPLTILAGANSSGKSSIMQPLLLMKQTLESEYEPGTFKLEGPNAKFTSATQFLTILAAREFAELHIHFELDNLNSFSGKYKSIGWEFEIVELALWHPTTGTTVLHPNMTEDELKRNVPTLPSNGSGWHIVQDRCFLNISGEDKNTVRHYISVAMAGLFTKPIHELIHVPGLRGNPERTYKSTGNKPIFTGTFQVYAVSIINQWAKSGNKRFKHLISQLEFLGLTSDLMVKQLDDVTLELLVGSLPPRRKGEVHTLVSIADVGFGVSQALPVLVALLVAEPGQLVYIEQPELHLHPRAQVALAQVLADAANRGVRVVAETHSSLLLLGVQTLIAEGKLAPENVMLHWFTRNEEGVTTIRSEEPDENGAYGDWPEDFDDVQLNAQKRYLDAVAEREMGMANGNRETSGN